MWMLSGAEADLIRASGRSEFCYRAAPLPFSASGQSRLDWEAEMLIRGTRVARAA